MNTMTNMALIDSALSHLSNALDDLHYSPDQRPVPLIREAMDDLRTLAAQLSEPQS